MLSRGFNIASTWYVRAIRESCGEQSQESIQRALAGTIDDLYLGLIRNYNGSQRRLDLPQIGNGAGAFGEGDFRG